MDTESARRVICAVYCKFIKCSGGLHIVYGIRTGVSSSHVMGMGQCNIVTRRDAVVLVGYE